MAAIQRRSTLTHGNDFDDITLDFDPWAAKLEALSNKQLAEFINKKA